MPDPTGLLFAFLAFFLGLASLFSSDLSEDEPEIDSETDEIEPEFSPVSL